MNNNLLLDDHPILVSPKLAELLGLNEAIFLQQIHYWLKKSTHFYDGCYWTYGTHEGWQEQFPFWSISTVRRTITSLEKKGILFTGNYNKAGFDKTKWYSINYDNLESMSRPSVQNEQTSCSEWTAGAVQNEQTNTLDLPETSTDISNTSSVHSLANDSDKNKLKDNFEKLWELYPNKKGKDKAFKSYCTAIKDGVTNKQIQDGIINYIKQINHERIKPQFIAHGSTWFNNKRWNDDYSIVLAPGKSSIVTNTVVEEQEMTKEQIAEILGDLNELGDEDNASP